MTLDEGIKLHKDLAGIYEAITEIHEDDNTKVKMQCQLVKEYREIAGWFEELKRYREQKTCEDCISREDALMALTGEWSESRDELIPKAIKRIKNLSPVTPEPKTGHWIIEVWNNKEHHTCSNCQHIVTYEPCYHYCPYCGAEIVEQQGER